MFENVLPGLHPAFLHPGSSLYPSPFPPGHPLAGSVLGRGGGEGGHPLAGPGGHHPLLGRPSVPHPTLFPSSVSQHHPLFSPGIISGHLEILAIWSQFLRSPLLQPTGSSLLSLGLSPVPPAALFNVLLGPKVEPAALAPKPSDQATRLHFQDTLLSYA